MPRYRGFTHAQSLILGYLISAGGNAYSGSTVKEIMAATGLSQNGAYKAIKTIPGVQECRAKTPHGAAMYFASPEAMAVSMVEPDKSGTIWDSKEWSKASPHVFAGLDMVYRKAPASIERVREIIKNTNTDEGYNWWEIAVAGQAIALLAFDAIEAIEKEENNG